MKLKNATGNKELTLGAQCCNCDRQEIFGQVYCTKCVHELIRGGSDGEVDKTGKRE